MLSKSKMDTIRDDDEKSKNIKALNKDYSENKFILWESLVADDAIIYINNNKLPKGKEFSRSAIGKVKNKKTFKKENL